MSAFLKKAYLCFHPVQSVSWYEEPARTLSRGWQDEEPSGRPRKAHSYLSDSGNRPRFPLYDFIRIKLDSEEMQRQPPKRWNIEFLTEGKMKHLPCLGKNTDAEWTCVYGWENDDLRMFGENRNAFIFLCNYPYVFLRYRSPDTEEKVRHQK